MDMVILINEKQYKRIVSDETSEIKERARSFANTRKKRLFPKSALMANPARFKKYDKEIKGIK
jgi:hypothetical protein